MAARSRGILFGDSCDQLTIWKHRKWTEKVLPLGFERFGSTFCVGSDKWLTTDVEEALKHLRSIDKDTECESIDGIYEGSLKAAQRTRARRC